MSEFDPKRWLSQKEEPTRPSEAAKASQPEQHRDVERVLQALESRQLDITAAYLDWLHLGFALANGFGEEGREYFHRVSRFYPAYNYRACDKQYTYCLRSRGSGISLATFFYLAKEAGISLSRREPDFLDEPDYEDWFGDIRDIPLPGEPPEGFLDPLGVSAPPPAQTSQVSKTCEVSTPGEGEQKPSREEDDNRLQERRMMEMDKWSRMHQASQEPQTSQVSETCEVSTPSEGPKPVSSETAPEDPSEASMPSFPQKLYDHLPEFLKKVVAPAETAEERDLLLLGSLGAVSACFPKLKGLYDSKETGPNLYLFVTAQASSGKGKLSHCKQLVAPLHRKLRQQAELLKQEYELELAEFNMGKGEKEGKRKPQRPPERMLFLPANSSASGMIQLLAENEGRGLIFENEADTLAQSLRTDFSNYSDSFRKAYHHEGISYFRKTNQEYVSIDKPFLSTVISGTPKQMVSLIGNREDGLFSRFIFYYMNKRQGFRRVFEKNQHGNLDFYYSELGKELQPLLLGLMAGEELWVEVSRAQQDRFYAYFDRVLAKYRQLKPEEYDSTVKRLGLVSFRMCMLFTAFRVMEDGEVDSPRTCSDTDFDSVLSMAAVLIRHSSRVFNMLPELMKLQTRLSPKELFLEKLPAEFNRTTYLQLAGSIGIKEKSAEGYISEFLKSGMLEHPEYNRYLNPSALAESSGKEGGSS